MADCVSFINISKRFGNKVALNNLSLSVSKGSTTFLIGLNGAGKTTLLRIAAGLVFPDSGSIHFTPDAIAKNIGSTIASPEFYNNLTAYENLRYYSIAWQCSAERILPLLQAAGLEDAANVKVKAFSTGMKQRLAIARALLSNCELLLLDEPMNGLDPAGITALKKLVRRLHSESITVVISSHLLEETRDLATDYAMLHNGGIISSFGANELEKHLGCICFDKHEDMKKAMTAMEGCWHAKFETDQRFLLFPALELHASLQDLRSEIISQLGLSCEIDKANLSEYFLGITEGL